MTTDQQGLIVLSLVQGKMVNNIPSNLTSLQISRELKDFLNLCFVFEDKNKGANELLDHDFITVRPHDLHDLHDLDDLDDDLDDDDDLN